MKFNLTSADPQQSIWDDGIGNRVLIKTDSVGQRVYASGSMMSGQINTIVAANKSGMKSVFV